MDESFDGAAVIGAGAAGLLCAIQAARLGVSVLLFDSREKFGAKILMSGGTRCNLTNKKVTEKDFATENPRVLKAVLSAFRPEETVDFFRELGIHVVEEAGGKYFPSTHSGRTVLEALRRAAGDAGVRIEAGRKVTDLVPDQDRWRVVTARGGCRVRAAVLATGGLSFPATGSDGSGCELARKLGHTVVPMTPSLVPLITRESQWQSLRGIALPVRLRVEASGKKRWEGKGDLLFTHFGFSGPAALNASRYWIRERDGAVLYADFLPDSNGEQLRRDFMEAAQKHPGRQIRTWLREFFPGRFVDVFLARIGVRAEIPLGQMPRAGREALVRKLFRYPLEVSSHKGYEKAEVTAGGIPLGEVDPVTLQSRESPGLFLAGEILDVDGRIGGFNFQWAWASATAVARGLHRHLS